MCRWKISGIGIISLMMIVTISSYADVPSKFTYQGRLTDTGGYPVADSTYSITFTIYDASDVARWTDTYQVEVDNGLFSVIIGDPTPFDQAILNPRASLGIKIGEDPEISPRTELVSVPYACIAQWADTAVVAISSITGDGGWVDDGGYVRLQTITDSVGIGTDAPQAQLHVMGQGRFHNNIDGQLKGATLFSEDTEAAAVYAEATGEDGIGVYGEAVTGADPWAFYFQGKGYVSDRIGIATTSPSSLSRLHIAAENYGFGWLVATQCGSSTCSGSEIGMATSTAGWAEFAKNAYHDGAWQRFNTGYGACLQEYSNSGDVFFYAAQTGANPITWTRSLTLSSSGKVGVNTATPQKTLHVNGTVKAEDSVICCLLEITGGCDIAEPFDILGEDTIEPGMVVSIDPSHTGRLKLSSQSYDHCVAGIISGAGGINPGMLLSQSGAAADGQHPVAMTGRVYCQADASYGAIQPGDLLTTSDTPGHAMKVSDYVKAQGAVIGKAMSALEQGRGLVLVLVTLQ